jgi:transposase
MVLMEVFMSSKRYTEAFKVQAVRQVRDRGHTVADVAARLGATTHSLYAWLKRYGDDTGQQTAVSTHEVENRRLRAELKRVTEERDILKKAAAYFTKVSG